MSAPRVASISPDSRRSDNDFVGSVFCVMLMGFEGFRAEGLPCDPGPSILPSTHSIEDKINAVFVLEETSNPDCRCHGIQLYTDPFAIKILRLFYPVLVYDDEAVSEGPRREYW